MNKKTHLQNLEIHSDHALYSAWCAGNLAAANVLLQRFQPQVLMMAYRYAKDGEVAKDVAQNAWIEICKKAKASYEIDNFKAYLNTVVRNKYFDLFRKNKNAKETAYSPQEIPDHRSFDLEKQMEQQEQIQLSRQFILSLPPLQKQCYALYVLEELSMEEIAAQLDISVNQVRGRIDRAKKRMKNLKNEIL